MRQLACAVLLGVVALGACARGAGTAHLVDVPEASAAPASEPVAPGEAPPDGVYFGRTWYVAEERCPGAADTGGGVQLDVLTKIAVADGRVDVAVDVDLDASPHHPCTPDGFEPRSIRAKLEGVAERAGGVLRLHLTRQTVAEVSPDGPLRGLGASPSVDVALACTWAPVEAAAHDDVDDPTGLGVGTDLPGTRALACRSSKALLEGARFEDWLDGGVLLLAPDDGIDRRVHRAEDGTMHQMRILGARSGHLPLWRDRIGAW